MAKDTAIAVNASVRTLAGELKAALKLNEGKVAMNDDAYEQHLTANGPCEIHRWCFENVRRAADVPDAPPAG